MQLIEIKICERKDFEMKKRNLWLLAIGGGLLFAFALWTVLVVTVDVQGIGPEGSTVGFATVNGLVRELVGVNWTLYAVTDWLGLVPFAVALGFAVLGLVQWIKRKNNFAVDRSILVLGGFYVVVIAFYLLFEVVSINYRPVLINGVLETSYPSSTTMLVMCVMPTAIMQLRSRIKLGWLRAVVVLAIAAFTIFMVAGRLLSGVHWISDIVGGGILSAGLVTLCYAFTTLCDKRKH